MVRDPETFDLEISLLLEGIYRKYGNDFRNYSPASVRRRVELALDKLSLASVSQLQDRIFTDVTIYDRLLQFLTVPTSEMFRDPTYYRAIRDEVVPILRTYPSVKIWIAGCSTGEELYSMAILLKEEDLLSRTIIYGTDINPRSLAHAKEGIYNIDMMKQYTQNYQRSGGLRAFSDYYQAAYGSARFDPSLRENMVFADHSLSTDSAFAEVQFISCRNVLIYFNRELQDRVFGLFSDSLAYRGILGLGSKETLRFSHQMSKFEDFVADQKIYRKLGAVR